MVIIENGFIPSFVCVLITRRFSLHKAKSSIKCVAYCADKDREEFEIPSHNKRKTSDAVPAVCRKGGWGWCRSGCWNAGGSFFEGWGARAVACRAAPWPCRPVGRGRASDVAVALVCADELSDGPAGHLLEEAHQVVGLREMESVGYLFDALVREEQGLFHFLQQALFEQVACADAELVLDRPVERDAAQVHHQRIVFHAVFLSDVGFKELFVAVGLVVFRWGERQVEATGVEAVELQEELVEVGEDHLVAVGHGVTQFAFHVA